VNKTRAFFLGWIYRALRRLVIVFFALQSRVKRESIDLEHAVLLGDRLIKTLNGPAAAPVFSFPIPKGIGVELHGLYFPSPLTIASFKDDIEILSIWLRMGMGGACIKTILKDYREGNPRPRLQEVVVDGKLGCINAMGIPGKGVEGLIPLLSNESLFTSGRPIGISIGGFSEEEYWEVFLKLNTVMSLKNPASFYYELNVSCPNVPKGHDLGRNPDRLSQLMSKIRTRSSAVVGIKVSPNLDTPALCAIGEVARSIDRVYINAGNTSFRRCVDVGLPEHAISIGGGGLSGPALFPRTLEAVSILSQFDVPIMATGGVSTIAHVRALRENGAVLFGMATALIQNPYQIVRLNHELRKG